MRIAIPYKSLNIERMTFKLKNSRRSVISLFICLVFVFFLSGGFLAIVFFQVHSENRAFLKYKCTKQRQIDGGMDMYASTKYQAFLLCLCSIYLLLMLKCADTFCPAFLQSIKSNRKLGQDYKSLKNLTHFSPVSHFYTP